MISKSAHNTYCKLVVFALSALFSLGLAPFGAHSAIHALAQEATSAVDEISNPDGQRLYSPISSSVSEPEDVFPADDQIAKPSEETDEAAIETDEPTGIAVRSGISLRSSEMILDYYSKYSDEPFLKPATTYSTSPAASRSGSRASAARPPLPT